jgi:hypothetical protein
MEEDIARLQLTQAREVLEFLRTRFDNVELFEWMVRCPDAQLPILMQLATSVARLAQRALEFERQESVNLVLADYWTVTNTSLLATNLSGEQQSAGLLGAERLSTDLTKLDVFKLQTETRRLQLTKTISLAQVLSGRVPGIAPRWSHHVQHADGLVRTATFRATICGWCAASKVSVFALVPPLDGIHAMLHNGGESSVVVPDRDPVTGARRS